MSQTIITKERIEKLPRDALYVVPINFPVLAAAVRLSISIERADVTFVTPLFLAEDALGQLPKRRPIEVHEGVRLEPEQQKVLEWYMGKGDGTAAA